MEYNEILVGSILTYSNELYVCIERKEEEVILVDRYGAQIALEKHANGIKQFKPYLISNKVARLGAKAKYTVKSGPNKGLFVGTILMVDDTPTLVCRSLGNINLSPDMAKLSEGLSKKKAKTCDRITYTNDSITYYLHKNKPHVKITVNNVNYYFVGKIVKDGDTGDRYVITSIDDEGRVYVQRPYEKEKPISDLNWPVRTLGYLNESHFVIEGDIVGVMKKLTNIPRYYEDDRVYLRIGFKEGEYYIEYDNGDHVDITYYGSSTTRNTNKKVGVEVDLGEGLKLYEDYKEFTDHYIINFDGTKYTVPKQ